MDNWQATFWGLKPLSGIANRPLASASLFIAVCLVGSGPASAVGLVSCSRQ
jgi:hypothetical protein